MNFVDKDGATKVYIPVRPWPATSRERQKQGNTCFRAVVEVVHARSPGKIKQIWKSVLSYSLELIVYICGLI